MSTEQTKSTELAKTNHKSDSQLKTINVDGHRPVEPKHLDVEETLNIDGKRPINPSTIQIKYSVKLDGKRPIAKSPFANHPKIRLDGKRPIASNRSEGVDALMGYLD